MLPVEEAATETTGEAVEEAALRDPDPITNPGGVRAMQALNLTRKNTNFIPKLQVKITMLPISL